MNGNGGFANFNIYSYRINISESLAKKKNTYFMSSRFILYFL